MINFKLLIALVLLGVVFSLVTKLSIDQVLVMFGTIITVSVLDKFIFD